MPINITKSYNEDRQQESVLDAGSEMNLTGIERIAFVGSKVRRVGKDCPDLRKRASKRSSRSNE
jgi:hypothetical protein